LGWPEQLQGYAVVVSDYEIPKPEPKEIDEKNWMVLSQMAERAVLRGEPYLGKEQCNNCLYYLDPQTSFSYCWHPTLRILVGQDWWCQWWEKIED
jgi:hypothetical protein